MSIVISQLGQQSISLPFYEVVIGTQKYVMGCDGGGIMVFKPRNWLEAVGFTAANANTYQNAADSALISGLSLNTSLATILDGRFPAQANLGDGTHFVQGFDGSTGWAAGFPTNSKTVGTTTGTAVTTTGTTTTGTTGTTTTSTTVGTTDSPVIIQSATLSENISTFLAAYWWAGLLIVVALLWKPFIAPALGIKPARRRR